MYRLQEPIYNSLYNHQVRIEGVMPSSQPSGIRTCTLESTCLAITINITENDYQEIRNRILINNQICKTRHQNILLFHGTSANGNLVHLLFEQPQMGQLVNYLPKFEENGILRLHHILKVLYGIGCGLEHLHKCDIVHGNIQGLLKLYM